MSDPTRPIPSSRTKRAPQQERAVPRKPGHVSGTSGDHGEEHVPENENQHAKLQIQQEQQIKTANQKINEAKKVRPRDDSDSRKKKQQSQQQNQHPQQNLPQPQGEGTKAGVLAHNAAFQKFASSPNMSEIVAGKSAPKTGESLAQLLPQARIRPDLQLPDVDIRPPMFLTPLQAMSDIYMKTRGRMSRKTKDLLESTALEDLIAMINRLFENEQLSRLSEARLTHKIWSKLKDDPGPLLLGLNDPRLLEPWRLFLDRWDIWTPADDEESGVELFWEGEGEDDGGEAIELLQSLTYAKSELTLFAKMGAVEDKLTFDGEVFYRLKT
jgi:hypothetical protein